MHEIKCRGKRIDNGRKIKGSLVQIGSRCWIVPSPELSESDDMREVHCSFWGFIEVIPETVGQYTGLKDKNGKEMYEKMRIRCTWSNGLRSEGIIEYYLGAFRVRGDDNTYDWLHDLILRPKDEKPEVIGNVHDNPELLEK